jgi:hypothetical protein
MHETDTEVPQENYLPHLWLLCAVVSAVCAVAAGKLAWTGTLEFSAIFWPVVGAVTFGVFAILAGPADDSR